MLLSRLCPTSPRLIEARTGPARQLAIACSSLAASTTLKIGQNASNRALALIATTASPASSRLAGTWSTSAPMGICITMADSVPIVRISPMSNWVQFFDVR